MELIKRRLGRTNLMVTALGLGTFQITGEFGVHPDEGDRIVDYAIENGINYIDTAEMYGFGESEELVGRALDRHPDKKIYVSTKVGWLDRTVARNLGEKAYRDPVALKRCIKHSFWLLKRDYVEIFMVHEPNVKEWWGFDYKTGDAVVMDVLEDLKKEGLIGAIGLGGWDCNVNADLIETGRFDVVLSAGGISLLNKPMFERLLPVAKKHDVGVVVGGTLGQGWNPFILRKDREGLSKLKESEKPEERVMAEKLEKIYDIADELDCDLFELTVRYVLSIEDIHAHIPGAREVAHLKSNLAAALKGPLDKKYVDMINAI